MTGRYPQRFGFDWVIRYDEKDRGLPVEGASLPQVLKNRGYATALIGKWHLGFKPRFGPNAHGFDEFFGFLGSDLDYYAHTDQVGDPGLYADTKLIQEKGYLTDLITDHSLAFLKRHAASLSSWKWLTTLRTGRLKPPTGPTTSEAAAPMVRTSAHARLC